MTDLAMVLLLAAGCPETTARVAAPMIVEACTASARATTATTATCGDVARSGACAPGETDTAIDARGGMQHACTCDDGDGKESCIRAVVVLWWLEGGGAPNHRAAWTLTPSTRHACGPLQVLPNQRIGRGVVTPSCAALRDPATGFRWGVSVWHAKVRRVVGELDGPLIRRPADVEGRLRAVLRAFNGHPRYRDGYARRGVWLWKRLQRQGDER